MIMRKVRPLTFSPGPGPYHLRGSITRVEEVSSRSPGLLCVPNLQGRHGSYFLPGSWTLAEAPGTVSGDQGLWPPIRSNDMLAASLAAFGKVQFVAALSDTAAALRQSRTLTVSLVGEVSRGTPVGPSGREMGVGQKGHLGG